MDLDMMRFRSSVAAAGVLRNTITDHNTQAPPGMHRNLGKFLQLKFLTASFYMSTGGRTYTDLRTGPDHVLRGHNFHKLSGEK